jgi:hypothetical protein
MKKTVGILLVIYSVFMAVQLINHSSQKASLNLNLANIINDYNVIGEQAFKEKILNQFRFERLKVRPKDIVIIENRNEGKFRVEIHYQRTFYFLIFSIKREMVISREGSKLNI